MVAESQKRATAKYIKTHYEKVLLTMPIGEREKVKQYAEEVGMSMNSFIMSAVRDKMTAH